MGAQPSRGRRSSKRRPGAVVVVDCCCCLHPCGHCSNRRLREVTEYAVGGAGGGGSYYSRLYLVCGVSPAPGSRKPSHITGGVGVLGHMADVRVHPSSAFHPRRSQKKRGKNPLQC